jgi:hypothetical protein
MGAERHELVAEILDPLVVGPQGVVPLDALASFTTAT